MRDEFELPNGDTVTEGDVILHDNYPFRVVFPDDDEYALELSPLYWGDSGMDVPFRDRDALREQWAPDSRGTLTPEEWSEWLRTARRDDRFGDDELDELERELPTADGPVERLRRLLGL
ncbi:hypothetical protein [Halomicrococcus gelatinilyticus]|uniref:hypothetical protein n=1 Tax=Halomicrococcus gelatinilyticus TaxID=1702103 RepID=UPI002E126AEF